MSGFKAWWLAARPRTLPASLAPILVGSAFAYSTPDFSFGLALVALLCALVLQVMVNFANDLFDAERGIDSAARLGPARMVHLGLISQSQMRGALWLCAALALLLGGVLITYGNLWLAPVGLACLVAAYAYSGGPYPIASLGLGELVAFLFFGPVAVVGSYLIHSPAVPAAVWLSSVVIGLPVAAIMLVNNIRDCVTDAAAGKRTLAVRLGMRPAQLIYLLLLNGSVLLLWLQVSASLLGLLLLLLSTLFAALLGRCIYRMRAEQLNQLLALTAQYVLYQAFCVALLLA